MTGPPLGFGPKALADSTSVEMDVICWRHTRRPMPDHRVSSNIRPQWQISS
jgi:hypothetical protein